MSRWMIMLAMLSCMAGCGNYDFKVNEKVVYTPQPLFSDFAISDPALRACVEQAIIDQKVVEANQLLILNCSNAGISALDGLEIFTGLRQLKLSANAIRNLMALATMSSLESLYLDDNEVVDPVPLYELLSLRNLDLSGNAQLQCPAGNALFQVEDVTLPEHCRRP